MTDAQREAIRAFGQSVMPDGWVFVVGNVASVIQGQAHPYVAAYRRGAKALSLVYIWLGEERERDGYASETYPDAGCSLACLRLSIAREHPTVSLWPTLELGPEPPSFRQLPS